LAPRIATTGHTTENLLASIVLLFLQAHSFRLSQDGHDVTDQGTISKQQRTRRGNFVRLASRK